MEDHSLEIVPLPSGKPGYDPCEVVDGELVDEHGNIGVHWRWKYWYDPRANQWHYEFKIPDEHLARANDAELKEYQRALITLERFAKGKVGRE